MQNGHAPKVGVADLRAFAKVEDKLVEAYLSATAAFPTMVCTRLAAVNSVFCMDGLDLYEMLDRNLAFTDVLKRKIHRAAETADRLYSVRDFADFASTSCGEDLLK